MRYDEFREDHAMPPKLMALGIDRMSIADRLELIEAIWDSVADHPDEIPLTEAQKQELDRRLDAHRADPGKAIPWEVIKEEALARMGS